MARTEHAAAAQRERHAAALRSVVQRIVEEVCNWGDLAVLDEVLGPFAGPEDRTQAPLEMTLATPLRAYLDELPAFRAAVPDARWTILDLVAEDETVVARLEVRGSFSGTLVGLAPPGRPATLTGVAICRFEGVHLVGLWLQADLLGLMQQLGVMPPLSLTQAVTVAQVLQTGSVISKDCPRAAGAPDSGRRV
jgi:predicted ester cyclase